MFYRMLVNSLSLLGDAVWEDVCPEIGKDKDSASAYCCRLFLPSFLHSIYPTVHNNNWSISISVSVSSSSSNRYRFDRWSGSWIHPLMSDCEWSYWSCLLHEEKSLLVVERSRWIRAQVINRLLIQQYSLQREICTTTLLYTIASTFLCCFCQTKCIYLWLKLIVLTILRGLIVGVEGSTDIVWFFVSLYCKYSTPLAIHSTVGVILL